MHPFPLRLALALGFAAGTALVLAAPARTATLVVPDDYPSPAEALAAGAPLGVDTVLVRSGDYSTTVLSDLPGGNVRAGAVLYSGVHLLPHPDNALSPVIDVGAGTPGSPRVAVAIAGDGGAVIAGFILSPGPRRSLEAYQSSFTMHGCQVSEGLSLTSCPEVVIEKSSLTARAGDAVFAQDSQLTLTGNWITGAQRDAVTWVSSSHGFLAEYNTITGNGGFGLVLSGTGVLVDVRWNVIAGNAESAVFLTLTNGTIEIMENTIWQNGDIGVWSTSGATVTLLRNIIGRNQVGVACESPTTFNCNDLWMNTVADYEGPSCGDHVTDFALDPDFCCIDGSCFTLQSDSPCAPGNSGGCGQVGARAVGCGTSTVEPATWGAIKSRFRR